jgi:hypothetical protein
MDLNMYSLYAVAQRYGLPLDELKTIREEILASKLAIEGPGACVWQHEVLALWAVKEAMRLRLCQYPSFDDAKLAGVVEEPK